MSKGCDLAWRWSSNCHNNVWVRSSLIHRARWLLHKRSHEWVSCLMRRNEDLHSHELKAVVILCFINSSCLSRLGWFPCQHALPRRVRLLAKEPIIIDLLASPWAKKKQKYPASLSSARNTSSKRQLDDTVPWHTAGICPSLWTVNESATDDISHYEKPVVAHLHCSSCHLNLILHRWWWKCCSQSPAGERRVKLLSELDR